MESLGWPSDNNSGVLRHPMSSRDHPGDLSAPLTGIDAPAVKAAKMLGGIIATCRTQAMYKARAEVDLRAVSDIQRKLAADPNDVSARQWVRQLAQTWSFRVRDNTRSIRQILDLLEDSGSTRR